MTDIQEKVHKIANEIARRHAEIIEKECKMVIDKFKCNPEDLIIKYDHSAKISIDIKAVKFEIENVFYWNADD